MIVAVAEHVLQIRARTGRENDYVGLQANNEIHVHFRTQARLHVQHSKLPNQPGDGFEKLFSRVQRRCNSERSAQVLVAVDHYGSVTSLGGDFRHLQPGRAAPNDDDFLGGL